jgi:hypothetical protein
MKARFLILYETPADLLTNRLTGAGPREKRPSSPIRQPCWWKAWPAPLAAPATGARQGAVIASPLVSLFLSAGHERGESHRSTSSRVARAWPTSSLLL